MPDFFEAQCADLTPYLSGAERVRAIELLARLRAEHAGPLWTRRIAELVKKDHSTIVKWLGIHRQPLLREAVAEGRLKIGHAMKLAGAPPDCLPGLLEQAPSLSQLELQGRVRAARRDPAARARQSAALNEQRAAQALRWLRLVDTGEAEEGGPVRGCWPRHKPAWMSCWGQQARLSLEPAGLKTGAAPMMTLPAPTYR